MKHTRYTEHKKNIKYYYDAMFNYFEKHPKVPVYILSAMIITILLCMW